MSRLRRGNVVVLARTPGGSSLKNTPPRARKCGSSFAWAGSSSSNAEPRKAHVSPPASIAPQWQARSTPAAAPETMPTPPSATCRAKVRAKGRNP